MAKEKTTAPVIDMNLFSTAEDMVKEELQNTCVSICPSLDDKLHGGIREGSVVLIRSLAKVGKTMIAVQIAQNALLQGRFVVYCDAERRLTKEKYLQHPIFNKNPNFMPLFSKVDEPCLSGEVIYKTVKDMMSLPKYKGAVYIIDSFSSIVTQATLDDPDIIANRRDDVPKLNADFCLKIGNIARTSKSIIIGIQHFITNTGKYGDPLIPKGGLGLEYLTDITLEARHKPFGWDGKRLDDDELTGQLMELNIPYNKIGAPYVSKDNPLKCYLKFGQGVWWGKDALGILSEMGLIITKGGWNTIILPEGEQSVQGMEKFIAFLEEKRDILEPLIKQHFTEKYRANYDFKNSSESAEPEPSKKKGGKAKE